MGADGKNLTRGRKVGLAAAALLAAALSCAALTRGCAPAPAPGSDAGSRPAAAAGPTARDGEAAPDEPDRPAQPEDAPSDGPAADPDGGAAPQKPAKGDKPSKPAEGQSSSKPSGGSNSGSTSKPSHKHTWVEQTAQKWVPDNVWVVDKAAWDEKLPGRSYVQCTCGATFSTNAEWSAHNESAMLAGDMSHRSSVRTEYTTIHHDEVGHWEDRGRNETVVTGYACSGCGATR